MPTAAEYAASRDYYLRTNKERYKKLKNWFAKYHLANKKVRLKRAAIHHESRKQFMIRLKESKPCSDCRDFFPYYVMHFDHRPGTLKLGDIARLKMCSKRALLEELQM